MRRVVTSDNLMTWMKSVIPTLDSSKHKGQAGRICVVGGSKEYTGAPYFAAISALLCGADLVHVICPEDAAPVIKSYSPELIVHPILCADYIDECHHWLDKMHAVVLGPGLGCEDAARSAHLLLRHICARDIPVVIDADGVRLVADDPGVLAGATSAVLTPNIAEARMLYRTLLPDEGVFRFNADCCAQLAGKIGGGVTIVVKGVIDIISNGIVDGRCEIEGSPRRCGGQGDLLSGSMGVMLSWSRQSETFRKGTDKSELAPVAAAYGACALTRLCARKAFCEKQRATITSDMINMIGQSFKELFQS